MKTTTKFIYPAFATLAFVLACFGLAPKSLATDTGSVLPGANTADGSAVLIGLTTGLDNSGFGYKALKSDTAGSDNTAVGTVAS